MVNIFYIVLALLLVLHTIFSLKKNKFLGLIVPLITIIMIFYEGKTEIYSIFWNNNTYDYSVRNNYEEKAAKLVENNEKYRGDLPENNGKTMILSLVIKIAFVLETVIYIVCWQIKKGGHGI